MNNKEITINTYNTSAEKLAAKFDSLGARISDIEEVFSLVTKKDPNVLEIGCGNGRDAHEILKHTNTYLGLDVSEKLIEIARKKNPEASFVVADIETFIFPKNLDVIFAFASLIHVNREHLLKIFTRAQEALVDGGFFRISLKHAEIYQEIVKNDEFGTRSYFLYSQEDIARLAESQFTIIKNDINNLRDQIWLEILLQK